MAAAEGSSTPYREQERSNSAGAASSLRWGVRTVDAFEKLSMIGQGAYGLVWKARDKVTKEPVALKQIKPHHSKEGVHRTALREIKILQRLRHPNIVGLKEIVVRSASQTDVAPLESPFENGSATSSSQKETQTASETQNQSTEAAPGKEDSGDDQPGTIYMVFEYVPYDMAGLILSPLKMDRKTIKVYVYQLLRALAHLHNAKHIHRDLKCSNILISDDNKVKLADFGLSRKAVQYGGTMTNNVITLWYRPPELLLGSTTYGPSVDMWSIGCILLELILGKPFFPGQNTTNQLNKVFDMIGTPSVSPPRHRNLTELPKWKEFSFKEKDPKLSSFLEKQRESGVDLPTKQLVEGLLQGDPSRRLTADAALKSTFFDEIRNFGNDQLPLLSGELDQNEDYHEMSAKARDKQRKGKGTTNAASSNKQDRGNASKNLPSAAPHSLEAHADNRKESVRNYIYGATQPEEDSVSHTIENKQDTAGSHNNESRVDKTHRTNGAESRSNNESPSPTRRRRSHGRSDHGSHRRRSSSGNDCRSRKRSRRRRSRSPSRRRRSDSRSPEKRRRRSHSRRRRSPSFSSSEYRRRSRSPRHRRRSRSPQRSRRRRSR
eukprot:gb/GECG01006847.1/.p1 GENE.gb/GECG01006847.1/~~gb/GECG01006847.1/.p1  ORF type:complete len:605 (+),score=70.32 gb/GECG01006847.1/:1-1815(+)